MYADSHFVIGHAHTTGGKPCQDYAGSGLLEPGGAYAIVSDGCSSGGHTDIGARLATLATAKGLKQAFPRPESQAQTHSWVYNQRSITYDLAVFSLGLQPDDLLATALYIYADTRQRFVHVHGDGVIAWRMSDDSTVLVKFDWANNAPSYPSYNDDHYTGFIAAHGGDLAANRLTGTSWRVSPEGDLAELGTCEFPLGYALEGMPVTIPDDVQVAAIFTDGVTQIDGMDWQVAVMELLNFKTMAGDFAKRRLNRFVKDRHSTGRGPIDDLAYAVIVFDTD